MGERGTNSLLPRSQTGAPETTPFSEEPTVYSFEEPFG